MIELELHEELKIKGYLNENLTKLLMSGITKSFPELCRQNRRRLCSNWPGRFTTQN